MQLKAKLIGDEDERAVSPVIGVILMVAITVILAAVIAAFVMDIGPGGESVQANFDTSNDNGNVTVTVNNAERIDSLEFRGCLSSPVDVTDGSALTDSNSTALDLSVGSSALIHQNDLSGCSNGDEISLVGIYDDSEEIIQTHDYDF